MSDKKRLVIVLDQILLRYRSIFFSKILLHEQEEESQQGHIRHYDIECEAVQALTDTLTTKIKAVKFRAFHLIKFHRKEEIFKRKPKNQNTTYVKNFSTASFYDRNGLGAELKSHLKFSKTSRHQPFPRTELDKTTQMLSDIDFSMSALMKKMKKLNSTFGIHNEQDPQAPHASEKVAKRKLILRKLNELESNLEELIIDEEHSMKSKKITSSHIALRYNPVEQKNSKSSRLFNRTFCVGGDNRY